MDRSHHHQQQQQLFSASKPPESFYIHMQRLLANKGGGGGKHEKKRRFNDDQIRLLETMFQTQTKLEPKQKLELARELGLQPRQVSIWFQNKRARWKSKQLEKEYGVLKSNFDGLVKSMECLKKENQFLTNQLEKLKEMLEQQSDKSTTEQDQSQSQSQSQREELESVRQDQSCCDDHMLYLEGNDTGGCIRLAGQGNHVSDLGLELDADYAAAAYHDQFCTASNVELWDHWPLAELNSVA